MDKHQEHKEKQPAHHSVQPEELAIDENTKEEAFNTTDSKSLLITIGGIVGIFILIFAGFTLHQYYAGDNIQTLDDLHTDNLEGKLDTKEGYIYDGFSVVYADGLWWTDINVNGQLTSVPLHFGPRDLQNISIKGDLDTEKFNNRSEVYMAINPLVYDKYYSLALSELLSNLGQGMNRVPLTACTMEDPVCVNRTILTCENNLGNNVIELVVEDTNPYVEFDGTCVKIVGSGFDIVRASNRLTYFWYGVMD